MTSTEPTPTSPPGPAAAPTATTGSRATRRAAIVGAGAVLLVGGAAAGAVVASTVGADAAQSSSDAGGSGRGDGGGRHGGDHGLPLSGTVTAVGTDSVTIETSSGTTTYGVTADSDIDKSGEAALADLAVGDTVTFSTTTVNGATVIDKLHAGDETKNKPASPSPTATST